MEWHWPKLEILLLLLLFIFYRNTGYKKCEFYSQLYLQSPAELQLLLSMQQQILEETRMLERIRQRQGSLPPRQQQQHRELVSRQQQLASLVARIRNPARTVRQEGGQP